MQIPKWELPTTDLAEWTTTTMVHGQFGPGSEWLMGDFLGKAEMMQTAKLIEDLSHHHHTTIIMVCVIRWSLSYILSIHSRRWMNKSEQNLSGESCYRLDPTVIFFPLRRRRRCLWICIPLLRYEVHGAIAMIRVRKETRYQFARVCTKCNVHTKVTIIIYTHFFSSPRPRGVKQSQQPERAPHSPSFTYARYKYKHTLRDVYQRRTPEIQPGITTR